MSPVFEQLKVLVDFIRAEVTRSSRSTHAIAIWASVCPRFVAIAASPRTFFRFFSDKKSFEKVSLSGARPIRPIPVDVLIGQQPLCQRGEANAADTQIPE